MIHWGYMDHFMWRWLTTAGNKINKTRIQCLHRAKASLILSRSGWFHQDSAADHLTRIIRKSWELYTVATVKTPSICNLIL